MAQVIQLRHTTVATSNPSSADGVAPGLLIGEGAVCVAAAATKLWVGVDGTLANNRLLYSTVDGDTTIMGGTFLKLTGGALTGEVTTNETTFINTALVTKQYVDVAVAGGQLYQGTYNAATNTPDLSLPANQPTLNGAYRVVSVAGSVPATVPGFAVATPVNIGDHLIWNQPPGEFAVIPAGGMSITDADARFLQLAGGTMANTPTPAVITMGAGYTPTANSQQVATMNALATATTGMLTAVATDGTSIHGPTGGTGALGSATNPLEVGVVNGGTF